MLAPDTRTTLLRELTPLPGYEFVQLVTTTFTLDLESALLPCLALAGSARAESADPVETIAAVQSTIAAIDIFHQNGQIVVPRHRSRLFSLLEPAIHGITSARGLFHPKLWLARYADEDGYTFVKLIVLTRNLTRDRSWDVVVTLDGVITTSPSAQNKPVVDLVRYLAGAPTTPLGAQRRERLLEFAELLRYAEWTNPDGVQDLTFHVFGVPGRANATPDFSGYRHLVVSPFLQDEGIQRFAEYAKGPLTVVSRQDALDGLSQEIADWIDDAYVLSPTAGLPADDENSSGAALFNGLHAKVFALERAKLAHLFIGSTNATGPAFDLNVEFLIELVGSSTVFGVEKLLGNDGLDSLLAKTEIQPVDVTDDDPQHALDSYVRTVAAVPLIARVIQDGDRIGMRVRSDLAVPSYDSAVTMSIALLTDPSTSTTLMPGLPVDVTYDELPLTDVTAFFVISAYDSDDRWSRTVVKAELLNDVEGRLDRIVTHEITSPDAFRKFLALLLAFGEVVDESDDGDAASGTASGQWKNLEQGMFEQLMRAAVSKPAILDQLAGVVSAIIKADDPHGVLPEGFRDLWTAIELATGSERGVSNV